MKIHILGRNALNCALYLKFNVFFGDDNFVENLSQKKLTKLPVLHIILAVRKGKRFYIHLIAKSDR